MSLGANGAAIVNMMDALMAHAPEIEEVVDSTGSGDALLGTFLAGMLKGYMPVKNLSDAIAAGSDTAQSDWLTDFRTTPALQKQ
ncbi:PfkB family carbohydrate kinase, partial [Gardnerella swidsinskii]|nr:PfkB family carbohydrate kinase [Gardnerella swidsinskii]